MRDSEITVARNYAEGAAGRFAGIDALPLTGQYTTYSLSKADGKPDYVPDSAASRSRPRSSWPRPMASRPVQLAAAHGSQLRVAGYGPGAGNVVGLTDNTDLYFTIRGALASSTTLPRRVPARR